jgi:hypothetical protein
MRLKVVSAVIVVFIVALIVAPVALAISQSTIDAILKDAADGKLDGGWSKAQVAAALAWLEDNPLAAQYTNDEQVLEGYLSGGGQPGSTSGGNLAFTGANLLLTFALGAGLIGGGLLLRRRLT